MGDEYDLYIETNKQLLARLTHKLKAILALIQRGRINVSDDGVYYATMTLPLTEPLDTLSNTFIEEMLRFQASDLCTVECPYMLTSVVVYPNEGVQPSASVNLEFTKDERY